MSKRAEQMAMKAYPVKMVSGPIGFEEPKFDFNSLYRSIFKEGYEQAEKDIALTWQDVAILIAFYEQEVELGNISRYEYEGAPALQDASEIILRKFNEIRKK